MKMTPFLKKILADGIRAKVAAYTDDQLIEFFASGAVSMVGMATTPQSRPTPETEKKAKGTRLDWEKFFGSAAAAGELTVSSVGKITGSRHSGSVLAEYTKKGILERVRQGVYRVRSRAKR